MLVPEFCSRNELRSSIGGGGTQVATKFFVLSETEGVARPGISGAFQNSTPSVAAKPSRQHPLGNSVG
jgi:hypothetical protein